MRSLILVVLLIFSVNVLAAEERRLLTMSDLAAYDVKFSADKETLEFKKRLFFTDQVNYKYVDDELSLVSMLSKHRSVFGKFSATRFGLKQGLKDLTLTRKHSDLVFGTKSEFYSLEKDGLPIGNVFISQVGKYIFTFSIVGLQVTEEFLEDVIRPKLLLLQEED